MRPIALSSIFGGLVDPDGDVDHEAVVEIDLGEHDGETELAMTGFAEHPTGIAFVNAAGDGWTGRDPCTKGTSPEELLGVGARAKLYIDYSPRRYAGIESGVK